MMPEGAIADIETLDNGEAERLLNLLSTCAKVDEGNSETSRGVTWQEAVSLILAIKGTFPGTWVYSRDRLSCLDLRVPVSRSAMMD
jgi:hypothetical protein